MTHDEIVARVASALRSRFGYSNIYTEYHPDPESQQRADIAAFFAHDRRPFCVVEVKPALKRRMDVVRAVAQVDRYVGLFRQETPKAQVLPLVIAGEITRSLDCTEFRHTALVWSLEMFERLGGAERIPTEGVAFRFQRDDEYGPIPLTHRERWL